ncbi:MAG: M50 family metallopeptidase [Ilumatobacteraceae bacterium]
MSSFYTRVREDLVGGGGDPTRDTGDKVPLSTTIAGVGVIVALLAWLAVSNVWTFVFVLGLIVSVFLHEIGHFVTARRTGMKVTQFYMGFGPKLLAWQRGEVEYGLRAFPIGAFVRIIGMNNLDETDPADEDRTYRSKSFPRRLLVITAGSLMHVVIALVLFAGVYSVSGRYGETGRVTVMDQPYVGSAAEAAGVLEGDVIVEFDGTPVASSGDFVAAVRAKQPGDRVEVVIDRNGEIRSLIATLTVFPGSEETPEARAFFGVAGWSRDYVQLGVVEAMGRAAQDVVGTARDSVVGVFTVLNPINLADNLTSERANPLTRPSTVVGASQLGGEVGRDEGWKGVLLLLGAVNVFVGVFNMMPLLPFDGGHAAVAIYERLRSTRARRYHADVRKLAPVATAVVVLLVMLLVAGLYLDITQPLG